MSTKNKVVVDADIEDIMPRYLEIRAEELELIRAALDRQDAEQISFLGHRLKGTGSSFGLKRLSEMGIVLEGAGNAKDFDTAAKTIEELTSYLNNLEIEYKDMG